MTPPIHVGLAQHPKNGPEGTVSHTISNIKDEKCFYPKFLFLFLCLKLCFFFFLLKMVHKEKNTKSQLKKTVCETVKFGSTKLT